MEVINIGSEQVFDNLINDSKVPVLVDFWATWCGPCKSQAPELEALAVIWGEKAQIVKVDVDAVRQLASRYSVRSIPTLVLFRDGQEEKRWVGLQKAGELSAVI